MTYGPPISAPWKPRWILSSLLVLATAIAFGGSLRNEFVGWDDQNLILGNPLIWTLDPRIWWSFDPELYDPLTLLAYQVLHLAFGFSPLAFHGFSLLVHIGNVILLFWFLRRIVADDRAGFLGALLFAVHPLHTEAIAWASGLKDLLCTFFFLLGVLSYSESRDRAGQRFQWLTPVFFILALLAKITAITLPLVLLLIDIYKHGKIDRQQLAEKWLYFAVAGLFGTIALVGRGEAAALLQPFQIVLLATRSIFFYLQKFIWPTGLSAIYPAPPIHIGEIATVVTLLGTIFFVGLCVWLRKTRPIVAFGIAFFLVTLLPSLLAYKKGGEVILAADRYAYLPSMGLIIVIAGFMLAFPWRKLATVLVLVAASISIPLAWAQTKTWASTEALFINVLKHYPTSSHALNNIGHSALQAGKLKEAEALIRAAIRYRESNTEAWVNLSGTLVLMKRYNEAESAAREAMRRAPGDAAAHLNLAWALMGQGKTSEAAAAYGKAVRLFPDYAGVIPALEQSTPGTPAR
jgi:tetratricopeptide (TPR) repeat protein